MSDSKTNKQSVGAQIPDRLFQVINLHSMARGQSKSQIIRDALLLWIERNNVDINALIQEVFANFEAEWLRIKNKDEDPSRPEFLRKCTDELAGKKVSEQIVDRIITRLARETNETKEK